MTSIGITSTNNVQSNEARIENNNKRDKANSRFKNLLRIGQASQVLQLDENQIDDQKAVVGFDEIGVLVLRKIREHVESKYAQNQVKDTDLPKTDGPSQTFERQLEQNLIKFEPHNLNKLNGQSLSTLSYILHNNSAARKMSNSNVQNNSLPAPLITHNTELKFGARNISKAALSNPVRFGTTAAGQNTEVKVSIVMGDHGLIIQITSHKINRENMEVLEKRMREIVRKVGEKIEDIRFFLSEDNELPKPSPIVKEVRHGSY